MKLTIPTSLTLHRHSTLYNPC